jgi:hypothetical protein
MHCFLQDLKQLIEDSRCVRMDYYHLLTDMKSYDFFTEVNIDRSRLLSLYRRALLRRTSNSKDRITNSKTS